MRVLPLAVLAVVVSGCYAYVPLKTSTPVVGQRLRVELTLTGGDSLARFLGPNVASVDGRLVIATESAYEIGVTQVDMHSGMEQYWKGETVSLPKPYIASVQERTFSWPKTGLLGGAVLVTMLALKGSGVLGGGLFGGGGTGGRQ